MAKFKNDTSCKKDSVIISVEGIDRSVKVVARAAKHALIGVGDTLYLVNAAHCKIAEGLSSISKKVDELMAAGIEMGKIKKTLSKPKKLGGRS
ncbi:hypothetical protein ACHJH3_06220 [Campylobacter sp. MOP7]|uniref:hypothetical protein n=1 Tax=Campylobacter canis TaxID=3378588 RepID=UPI00387E816D